MKALNNETEIEEEITNSLVNWMIPLIINQTSRNIKLDTGARENLINEADLQKMWIRPRIEDNDCNLTDYHGAPIKTLGTCNLQVERIKKEVLLKGGVDLEDTGSLDSVKQCIDTKSEADRNKVFKAKPEAVSVGDSTDAGGKCLLEEAHGGDVGGCLSNIGWKCPARTLENKKNEWSGEQDKQGFEKHGKKSNMPRSTDPERQTRNNWHSVAYDGLMKENDDLLKLKLNMKKLERTRVVLREEKRELEILPLASQFNEPK
ncbi:hypothetical protein scyTo_0005513 [Scyliorhinus torazame]|uniref:Uncharacterized protein n=1 Tax=Scyliorhinus torazame TaxID=75743 RepID=A0A401P980_SCYTO|nr:hypothetical protein [Scyliorhinus torazame]